MTSGQDRRPIERHLRLWDPLENLGFLRRFPIGRSQLYRNILEQLPGDSDDFLMTGRIPSPLPAALDVSRT